MNTNVEFCKKLFEKMKGSDNLTTYLILDYFSLKTAKVIEKKDEYEIGMYSGLFQNFAQECRKEATTRKFEPYFIALSDCISNYGMFVIQEDSEAIREYFKNLKRIMEE